MRLVAPLVVAALSLTACPRAVRQVVLETPLEAGVPAPFTSDRALRWDFGDGTAPVNGQQVTHAFARAGRYEVKGLEGDELREQVTVLVEPRPVFHAVPVDADLVLAVRTQDELSAAVDFAERLMGSEATQRVLERWPALGFAVEQASGGGGPLDAREGVAVFSWPEREVEVSLVGVADDAAALAGFSAWLGDHGWNPAGEAAGNRRFESADRDLDVFIDRGVLYAVTAPPRGREPSAQARIAAMSARGLEADGPTADALDGLAAGGVVVLLRASAGTSWTLLTLAVKVLGERAWVTGRAHAKGPLWTAPKVDAARLLSHAPEGPIAVASATLPAGALLALGGWGPGTPKYKALASELSERGVALETALGGFKGAFDAAAYFDVPGFVRGTVANQGRPEPAVSLMVEAPVASSAIVASLVDALASTRLDGARRKASRWTGRWEGRVVELALTEDALSVREGAPVEARAAVDLAGQLGARFEGAFSPGHVSLFFDVGQLRRELLMPRLLNDVDPRQALMAQALAVTFLDRLTQLDSVLLDAAPDEKGAVLRAVVTLRAPEPKPE